MMRRGNLRTLRDVKQNTTFNNTLNNPNLTADQFQQSFAKLTPQQATIPPQQQSIHNTPPLSAMNTTSSSSSDTTQKTPALLQHELSVSLQLPNANYDMPLPTQSLNDSILPTATNLRQRNMRRGTTTHTSSNYDADLTHNISLHNLTVGGNLGVAQMNTSLRNLLPSVGVSSDVTSGLNTTTTTPQPTILDRLITVFGVTPEQVSSDLMPMFQSCGHIQNVVPAGQGRYLIIEYSNDMEAREALKLHTHMFKSSLLSVTPTKLSELPLLYQEELKALHGEDCFVYQDHGYAHNTSIHGNIMPNPTTTGTTMDTTQSNLIINNSSLLDLTQHIPQTPTLNLTNHHIVMKSPTTQLIDENTIQTQEIAVVPYDIHIPTLNLGVRRATYEDYLRNRGCVARFWDRIRSFYNATVFEQLNVIATVARMGYTGVVWNTTYNKPPAKGQKIDSQVVSIPYDKLATILPSNLAVNNQFHTPGAIWQDYYTPITSSSTPSSAPSTNAMSDATTATTTTITQSDALVATTTTTSTTQQQIKIPDYHPFQQYQRLTVQISDMPQANSFSPASYNNQFDLIAIQPFSDQVLLHSLSDNLCDIIVLDLSKRLPFHIKPQHSRLALNWDIFFEVDYTSLFSPDVNIKRMFLQQLPYIVFITRGKNLIFTTTSSPACPVVANTDNFSAVLAGGLMACRTPSDIMNLFLAYQVPAEPLRCWLNNSTFQTMLLHARTRKVHKAVVEVLLNDQALPRKVRQNIDGNNNDNTANNNNQQQDGNTNNNNNRNNNNNNGNRGQRGDNNNNNNGNRGQRGDNNNNNNNRDRNNNNNNYNNKRQKT